MTTVPNPTLNRSIVVGIDYTELSDLALRRACELSSPETHLHVVHASGEMDSDSSGSASTSDLEEGSRALHSHVEKVVEHWCSTMSVEVPFAQLTTHMRSAHPAEALAQLASDTEANLVIVGTNGRRGAKRFLLGSVAESTVRIAPCAVLVVRPAEASTPQIEPACPQCVAVREASDGKTFWCEQHADHHERRHTYHYKGRASAHQSGFLIHR